MRPRPRGLVRATVRADSGWSAFVLFGTPTVCTAVAPEVEHTSRTVLAPAVVAALAVVSLSWALLTALDIGSVLVAPAFLLLAAVVSWLHRAGQRSAPSSQG